MYKLLHAVSLEKCIQYATAEAAWCPHTKKKHIVLAVSKNKDVVSSSLRWSAASIKVSMSLACLQIVYRCAGCLNLTVKMQSTWYTGIRTGAHRPAVMGVRV